MNSPSGSYPVPARVHRVEQVVRRSRFVTTLARAPDAEAAHAFVARARVEAPDATHHCWAFVAGAPGSMRSVGMSDDGEPHGTAGRPMLTKLLHGGVGEIVAVCVRWFGGTELGTGGLSRAYGGGVAQALESLPTELLVPRDVVELVVGYPHVDPVQHLLDEADARIVEADYGADVRYRVEVPAAGRADLEGRLADASGGEVVVRDVL